jgi:hypothetical protein
VVQKPCFFLGEEQDTAGSVGKGFEHGDLSCQFGMTGQAALPCGSRFVGLLILGVQGPETPSQGLCHSALGQFLSALKAGHDRLVE